MKMKVFNNNKKWFAMIAAVILLGGVGTGVTAALYTITTNTAVNGFKSGLVNISVVERTEKDVAVTDFEDSEQGNTIVFDQMSASGVAKYVAIKNHDLAAYPTVSTYVRVRLVPSVRYNTNENDNCTHDGEVLPIDMSDQVSYTYATAKEGQKQWLAQTTSDGELYYYYPEALDPGEVTADLIESVTYQGDIPDDAHFELQVLAEGVASDQTGSLSIWFADQGETATDYSGGYTEDLIDQLTKTTDLNE